MGLTTLSREFEVHCRNDLSKQCILFPKYVLESLNVWPDDKNVLRRWVMVIVICSIGFMGVGQIGYMYINATSISKVAAAASTLSTTFETIAKLGTMLYLRTELNAILVIIWHEFWPAKLANMEKLTEIKWRSNYATYIGAIFMAMAAFSSNQFHSHPLIDNIAQLPMESWYPFNFLASPLYEMMYIWQWFMNQIVISTLSGIDAMFNSLMMICTTQFIILQAVIENLFTKDFQWEVLFGKKDVSEEEVIVKCVQYHLKLIKVSRLIVDLFSHIIILQYVLNTVTICLSCIAWFTDPTLMRQMLSYCLARLVQFFYYCSVGNELTYQSGQVADAAFKCDWEKADNFKIRHSLVMIIQRAQRPEVVTVAGLLQLSLTNFISAVQMSFSFYTLLDSFI